MDAYRKITFGCYTQSSGLSGTFLVTSHGKCANGSDMGNLKDRVNYLKTIWMLPNKGIQKGPCNDVFDMP